MSCGTTLYEEVGLNTVRLLSKKLKESRVAQDLVRLIDSIKITRKKKYCSEQSSNNNDCVDDNSDFFIKGDTPRSIMRLVQSLCREFGEERSLALFMEKTNVDDMDTFNEYLSEEIGENNKIAVLLKTFTQGAMLAISNYFRKELIMRKGLLKDIKGGWEILVNINHTEDQRPTVIHRRKEQAFNFTRAGPVKLCEFVWDLEVKFDSKQAMRSIYSVGARIVSIDYSDNLDPETLAYVQEQFKQVFANPMVMGQGGLTVETIHGHAALRRRKSSFTAQTVWDPKNPHEFCQRCKIIFDPMKKKHTCNKCLKNFCFTCCYKMLPSHTHDDGLSPAQRRVCVSCYDNVMSEYAAKKVFRKLL